MVKKATYIIVLCLFVSCIYNGTKNSYGIPRAKFKNIECNSCLSKRYEGLYEERFYFSSIDKYGNYQSLVKTSKESDRLNKTKFIRVYDNCRVNIFIKDNDVNLKKEDFIPEKGLIGYLYSRSNKDYIRYYSVRDGEGRMIEDHIFIRRDTLNVITQGGSSGYIYMIKQIPEDWKKYKADW